MIDKKEHKKSNNLNVEAWRVVLTKSISDTRNGTRWGLAGV